MRGARVLLVAGMAVILTSAACASAADSESAETFRLTEVGGKPLPVSYPEENGCQEEIISATLSLESDGDWKMEQKKRETCGDGVEEDEDVEQGSYTVDGSTYRFTAPQGGTASPGEIEIENLANGTLAGDVLTARLADGTIVVFRRI